MWSVFFIRTILPYHSIRNNQMDQPDMATSKSDNPGQTGDFPSIGRNFPIVRVELQSRQDSFVSGCFRTT